jgi:hypothetical protein
MDNADPLQKLERELDHYFATRKDAILFSRSLSTGGGFHSSNLEGIYPEWVFPQLRRRGYYVRIRGNRVYVELMRRGTMLTPSDKEQLVPNTPMPAVTKRPRGRPSKIPVERKIAALNCKEQGGSYRDAARILYGTQYPSEQQVKNVSNVLNYFVKTQSKPNKTKG